MDKNNKNISFLNDKRTPTTEMIYAAFSIDFPEDFIRENSEYASNINEEFHKLDELGEADDEETLEGTEWIIRKLVWNTPNGIIAKFEVNKINEDFEDIIDIDYEDIDDEDSEDDFILSYKEKLRTAILEEEYFEASRLRDWKIDLDALEEKLKPLMVTAIEESDYLSLYEYLMAIKNYYKTI